MAPWLLFAIRYGLPGALILTGFVLLAMGGDSALDGWAMFTGSGLAVLLLNFTFRLGAGGDVERDEEDAAREYYERHGRWPDDPPDRAGRGAG
ncbi:MAG: hypothetical protein QOI91_1997 [Solirubrobacteraceae bacterium]|jgi:hypothetical protein|nr:hypothetical protein [Solirubrobacteraceae bacterium]